MSHDVPAGGLPLHQQVCSLGAAGRLSAGRVGRAGDDEGCITCGDIAVPLTVVAVTGADARCRDDAGREELVATELVGVVRAGDRVLVHAGVALEHLGRAAG